MKSLADTTELLETTTSMLMSDDDSVTPQAGVELIDQWIGILSESENTSQIADQLAKLRALLMAKPTDSDQIASQMETIAANVLLIAPETGAEGEMPSLLAALSAALRIGSGSTDQQ